MNERLFGDDGQPTHPIDEDTAGLVRNDHPGTSHAAAKKAKTGRLRRLVFEYLERRGELGATDEELIDHLDPAGHHANGIRPRRVELVRDEHVIDSGRRRLTRSGRSAIVWVVNAQRPAVAGTGRAEASKASALSD